MPRSGWLTGRLCVFSGRRRGRRCCVCVCVLCAAPVLLVVLTLLWCYGASSAPHSAPSGPYIHYFSHREFREKEVKTILLWDQYTAFSGGVWDSDVALCPVRTCRVTMDRSELRHSDAVLFSSRGMWNKFLPGYTMPAWRQPHQVWVISQMEAPPHTVLDWSRYNGVFNWTLHYRREADVRSTYSRIFPINSTHPDTAAVSRHPRNYAGEKTAMVAWLSSNCWDDARRQRVVQQLSRYIQVDTYGACGAGSCDPGCRQSLTKYRFYLALENAHCRDYHTEKFYNAFRREQIPVTDSDAHGAKMAPTGSYIQMSDFASLQDLAVYLKKLAASETAYNAYHSWRQTHRQLAEGHVSFWCQLCRRLHDRTLPAQVYTRLHHWLANDTCQPWSLCNYIKRAVEGTALYYRLVD